MEESDKILLDNLKNYDLTRLFKKNQYCEIIINDSYLIQGYIINEKDNQKFDVCIPNNGNLEVSINSLSLFGDNKNIYKEDVKMRKLPINYYINRLDISELINRINIYLTRCNFILNSKNNNINNNPSEKDNNSSTSTISSINSQNNNNNFYYKRVNDKNGNNIDVTGYFTYQLLEGFLLDCLSLIKDKLSNNQKYNSNLFILILDIVIYCAEIVKSNLNKYKVAYYNKKLLIVNQISAILISFDSLIYNLTPIYSYNINSILENKMSKIVNLVYQIILASKNKNLIPLQSLIIFIKLICY